MSIDLARRAYAEKNWGIVIAAANNALIEDKTNHEAFNLMGAACMHLDREKDAEGLFRRAIHLEPLNPRYQASLCAALRATDQIEESIVAGENSLRYAPDDVDFLLNTAASVTIEGDHLRARALLRQAVKVNPTHADAHVALGENLLLLGERQAGWRERDTWTARRLEPYATSFPSMVWNGMKLSGERIVVICDEGFGDAIQYARYIPDVAELCSGVILLCPEVLGVLGQLHGVVEVVHDIDKVPEHGAHCRISSLPAVLPNSYDAIEQQPFGYLQGKYTQHHEGWRVGLAWRGRPTPKGRSIPFPLLAAATGQIRPYTFVCLQPDVTDAEKALLPHMEVPALRTFKDTAEVMEGLDEVITIDSAVAHLAGAMGIRTWLCLSHANDWRWGTNTSPGATAPWYPTVRMVRQEVPGDWTSVVEHIHRRI